MLILGLIKLEVYMVNMNQNQLDVVCLEKEAVLLVINIVQKKYHNFISIQLLLKFFDGRTLDTDEKIECREILHLLDKYLQKYKDSYSSDLNKVPTDINTKDFICLYNKFVVSTLFNRRLLNISIPVNYHLLEKKVSLYSLINILIYLLQQRTFITSKRIHKDNCKTSLSFDAYVRLQDACYYGLPYPNSTTILNDFSTIEKLNIFFKPYFE